MCRNHIRLFFLTWSKSTAGVRFCPDRNRTQAIWVCVNPVSDTRWRFIWKAFSPDYDFLCQALQGWPQSVNALKCLVCLELIVSCVCSGFLWWWRCGTESPALQMFCWVLSVFICLVSSAPREHASSIRPASSAGDRAAPRTPIIKADGSCRLTRLKRYRTVVSCWIMFCSILAGHCTCSHRTRL